MADVGKINNRLVVDGEVYGGVAQGIGFALSEDFEDLKKHSSLHACGLPYCSDIPDKFDIHYVETPRENGPFGATGVGELPLTSSHVAVINAICDATGVRRRHSPRHGRKRSWPVCGTLDRPGQGRGRMLSEVVEFSSPTTVL